MALGRDVARAWSSPGATAETKKKIIRLLIAEIVVNMSHTLNLIIHWQGGDHTELTVKKNKAGHNRWVTDGNVVDLVSALARREGERSERGEATLDEAAALLSISPSTIRRMIKVGILPACQLCKGAPWIIRYADLSGESVRREADRRRQRRPASTDQLQTSFDL